jgi:hypothetical protein
MIALEKFWGVHLFGWFPGVVTFRVSFPLHEVLERPRPPMTSVINNALHLIFFLPIDKVRWWPGVVRSVGSCFVIW